VDNWIKCPLAYPVMTILRGKGLVDHGQLVGSASDNQWLRRKVAPDVLARPVVSASKSQGGKTAHVALKG
jgi:hypothetical protein